MKIMGLMGLMGFQVARRLFVVYQVVDGGVFAADGAGWSLLDFDGAELHGLGVERQQAVGEQFADAGKVFQRLGSLNGAQHAGNGAQYAGLRTRGYGAGGRRFLKEAAIACRARQMGERLSVESQDAALAGGRQHD